MLLYDNLSIEDLLYCALVCSIICFSFCQQSLNLGHESAEDNSEHDLAGMADLAEGTIVLRFFESAIDRFAIFQNSQVLRFNSWFGMPVYKPSVCSVAATDGQNSSRQSGGHTNSPTVTQSTVVSKTELYASISTFVPASKQKHIHPHGCKAGAKRE